MTRTEVIASITEAYSEMPDDTNIEGFFLVTMTDDQRALLAGGELDFTDLLKALELYKENQTT